jgi:cytochrome c oxidase subunit IV
MANRGMMTPQQLLNYFPEVKKLGWTSFSLLMFFKAGLLVGFYCDYSDQFFIQIDSFKALIQLAL